MSNRQKRHKIVSTDVLSSVHMSYRQFRCHIVRRLIVSTHVLSSVQTSYRQYRHLIVSRDILSSVQTSYRQYTYHIVPSSSFKFPSSCFKLFQVVSSCFN